jgi:chitin synthase
MIEEDLLDPTWMTGDGMSPSNLLTDMGMPGSDGVTRIFACATMWHETREEMLEMLKSIFRMDEDQSARRFARTYFSDPKHPDKDYYEFEST